MPSSKNGQALAVGDKVALTGKVVRIDSENMTGINIIVEADVREADNRPATHIPLAARMVDFVERPEPPKPKED